MQWLGTRRNAGQPGVSPRLLISQPFGQGKLYAGIITRLSQKGYLPVAKRELPLLDGVFHGVDLGVSGGLRIRGLRCPKTPPPGAFRRSIRAAEKCARILPRKAPAGISAAFIRGRDGLRQYEISRSRDEVAGAAHGKINPF